MFIKDGAAQCLIFLKKIQGRCSHRNSTRCLALRSLLFWSNDSMWSP